MSSFIDDMAINPYAGMDDDTARAILDIQIADLAEAEAAFKQEAGKSKDHDVEASASLFRHNLEEIRTSFSDRRMARSIANAVIEDGSRVSAHTREEQMARRDREMARQLQTGRQPQTSAGAQEPTQVDDATLSRMAGLFVSESVGRALMPIEMLVQETTKPSGGKGHRPKLHQCSACGDKKSYFEVIKAPCGEDYCKDCLSQLFEESYTDESLFPPRCCRQIIPVNSPGIELFLSKELREQYEPRRVEVETKDRTYCCEPKCSTFIPPNDIQNKIAACPKCKVQTCSNCKRTAHSGICADNTEDQKTLELALEQGWQKCSSCMRIVELKQGCNHITWVRL